MSDHLEPVLARAREAAVEEAKIEAESSAINTISKQQAHQGQYLCQHVVDPCPATCSHTCTLHVIASMNAEFGTNRWADA